MVLGVVRSDGQKCPIILIDADKKINRQVYEGLMVTHMIPWIRGTYPEGNFVFQHDGVPTHSAAAIRAKLTEELGGGGQITSGGRRCGRLSRPTSATRLQRVERFAR